MPVTRPSRARRRSIYDTMLELNKLPYLKPPELHESSHRCAHEVMDRDVLAICAQCTHLDAHVLLRQSEDAEFAVVDASEERVTCNGHVTAM